MAAEFRFVAYNAPPSRAKKQKANISLPAFSVYCKQERTDGKSTGGDFARYGGLQYLDPRFPPFVPLDNTLYSIEHDIIPPRILSRHRRVVSATVWLLDRLRREEEA